MNAEKHYSRWLGNGRLWQLMFAGYMLVLGFLSLNPWVRPVSTPSAFSPDKLDHALAYGGLVIIVYLSLAGSSLRFRNCAQCAWSAALTIAVIIGILIEIAQGMFTTSRTASVGDAVANACGALVGYIAFHAVKFLFNKK